MISPWLTIASTFHECSLPQAYSVPPRETVMGNRQLHPPHQTTDHQWRFSRGRDFGFVDSGRVRHSRAGIVFLLAGPTRFRNKSHENNMKVGSGETAHLKAAFHASSTSF